MAKHSREEDLDSEFEFTAEKRKKTWRDDPLSHQKSLLQHVPLHSAAIPSKQLVSQEHDKEEWRTRRFHYLSMDAYSRHKALVNQYLLFRGHGIEHLKRSTEKDRNDYTVLSEQHKFLWDESDQADTWEKKLAKTYYDRLFKEYAICDLSRYKENKVAMRWRTEKEVVEGMGQFVCGSKHCNEARDLQSWEVNFNYVEREERKNALVKLRLCVSCSAKLNHHHKRKLWKRQKKERRSKSKSKLSKHKKKKQTEHKKRSDRDSKVEWTEKEKAEHSSDSECSSDADLESGEGGSRDASSVWSQSAKGALEKPKEDEFDDYFKDMLL